MIDLVNTSWITLTRALDLQTATKGTLILLAGLGSVRLLHRARASVRHAVIAATFGGLLALPVALAVIPATVRFDVPIEDVRSVRALVATSADAEVRPPTSTRITPDQSAGNVGARRPTWIMPVERAWTAGLLATLIRLGTALWRLTRLRRSGRRWVAGCALIRTLAAESGVHRHVDVLLHNEIATPFAVGVWFPTIILPADAPRWLEGDLRRALIHELAHVRRRDWVLQLGAWTACAFHWFNPLVWIARRRLCLEAERACDDAVVTRDGSAEYADQLVSLAERVSRGIPPPALAMARRSDLSARVSAVLDSAQRRGPTGNAIAVIILLAMAVTVMSIASLQADPSSARKSLTARTRATASAGSATQPPAGPLDRSLYEAAEKGDINAIVALLDAGANVNAAIEGDGSPLIGAARQGHVEAVRLLLERGADPNRPVPGDGSPLIMAAREGHLAVVELLLERNASVDQVVADDENALIQASGHGRLSAVELLVAHGANVNARVWAPHGGGRSSGEWRTPLSMARRGGHTAVASFLLAAGARE
jgi:beta-lactamase regulating signal transducer with metallopeptidase domain